MIDDLNRHMINYNLNFNGFQASLKEEKLNPLIVVVRLYHYCDRLFEANLLLFWLEGFNALKFQL